MDALQRQAFRDKIFQAHHEVRDVRLTVDEAMTVSDTLDAVFAERDALQAWKDAVPVEAIDCIHDDARLENETPEVQAIWMQIGDWLAVVLDGAQ